MFSTFVIFVYSLLLDPESGTDDIESGSDEEGNEDEANQSNGEEATEESGDEEAVDQSDDDNSSDSDSDLDSDRSSAEEASEVEDDDDGEGDESSSDNDDERTPENGYYKRSDYDVVVPPPLSKCIHGPTKAELIAKHKSRYNHQSSRRSTRQRQRIKAPNLYKF